MFCFPDWMVCGTGARPVSFPVARMSAGQASAIVSSLKRAQPQPPGATVSVFGGGVAHSSSGGSAQPGGPVQGVVLHGLPRPPHAGSHAHRGLKHGVAAFSSAPLPAAPETARAARAAGSLSSPSLPLTSSSQSSSSSSGPEAESAAELSETNDGSNGGSSSNSSNRSNSSSHPKGHHLNPGDVVLHGSIAMPPMPPVEFLRRILVLHRYDVVPVSSLRTSANFYHRKPTPEQVRHKRAVACVSWRARVGLSAR
jgi:hypothetical protein